MNEGFFALPDISTPWHYRFLYCHMRHDLQHLSSMSVFSYSRKLSWGLYFLLALLQSSQGISGYGTLMWCRRMVSSHHSVVFQTAACDRLCYPGKTRRGYYQEPTLEFIKALISNYCWHVSAWLAGWDSNPHITGQSRASYSFLTTPYHYGRINVVVWTMSLPYLIQT